MTHYLEGRTEEFIYRRVSFPSLVESGDLGEVEGGSLSFSAFSDLKVTGAVKYSGDAVSPSDMVRVIYRFTDHGGTEERVLATCFPYESEPGFDGARWKGEMQLRSVLTIPASAVMGYPYTVEAGANAAALAASLMESLGVPVVATPSDYVLSSPHTFESSDTYLSVANWLLGQAGYASMTPDSYGRVYMGPYVEPTERTPSWVFADGPQSIIRPSISIKRDWRDSKNVARLDYSDEGCSLRAIAWDVDAESETSVSNTWERTLQETASELAGDTAAEKLAALEALAAKRLADNLARIEYLSMEHLYVPIGLNDSIRLEYGAAGAEWQGAVTSMEMEMSHPLMVETEARRFVRTDYKIQTAGEVLYESA